MTKFIILIGRKYFSNYVAQSSYRFSIQIKLLTAHFFLKKALKQETIAKLLKKEMISLIKIREESCWNKILCRKYVD